MFIVERIHKLSMVTTIFYDSDFTSQILYSFILDFKKLLQFGVNYDNPDWPFF